MGQVKCEYCGNFIDDALATCPHCGAANAALARIVHDTPQTIEELQEWYQARNLPLEEVTRFFIGKNMKEPRAFGIYRDGKNVVVYKNKSDGSRAVRYRGTDEAYGVNELYLRLKEEILHQKSMQAKRSPAVDPDIAASLNSAKKPDNTYYSTTRTYEPRPKTTKTTPKRSYYAARKPEDPEKIKARKRARRKEKFTSFLIGLVVVIVVCIFAALTATPDYKPNGNYYRYNNQTYVYLDDPYGDDFGHDQSGWYLYNQDEDTWDYQCYSDDTDVLGEELASDPDKYKSGDIYKFSDAEALAWGITSFDDTEYAVSAQSSYNAYKEIKKAKEAEERSNRSNDNNSWSNRDNDYDWDDDDGWDAGNSDWDSDW